MRICIIIPSFNLAVLLKTCLNSLLKTNYRELIVIVIDDGSNPSLKKGLLSYQKRFSRFVFLRNNARMGFAKSVNKGLRHGLNNFKKVDYFLLLNNDAYLKSNFFTISLKHINKSDLASPITLLSERRGVDTMGIDYYCDGTGIDRTVQSDDNYLLSASCLFVSYSFAKENLAKFGWFFIPEFESFAEDIELSLRAKLMNKKIELIPRALAFHHRTSTLNNKYTTLYLGVRNQLWTIITTWTSNMITKHIFCIIKGQCINTLMYSLKFKRLFMIEIYLQTLFNLPALISIRKKMQKNLNVEYPTDVFVKNTISLSYHLKRSKTYRSLLEHFKN